MNKKQPISRLAEQNQRLSHSSFPWSKPSRMAISCKTWGKLFGMHFYQSRRFFLDIWGAKNTAAMKLSSFSEQEIKHRDMLLLLGRKVHWHLISVGFWVLWLHSVKAAGSTFSWTEKISDLWRITSKKKKVYKTKSNFLWAGLKIRWQIALQNFNNKYI